MYFKNAGYKTFSGPFDWLAADDPASLADLLATDFADLTDVNQLVDHASGLPHQCGHAKYNARFFHHFNPRQPDASAYYRRCVDRFRRLGDVIAPGETVLCLLMVTEDRCDDAILNEIHAHLSRAIGPALEFVACVIAPDRAMLALSVERATPSFVKWNMTLTSHTVGTTFADPRDSTYFHAALHHLYTFDIAPTPFGADGTFERTTAYDIRM
jgi:hypothetical protein